MTICISSIFLDSKSTEKSRGGERAFPNISNFNLADPKLVPGTLTSFSEESNHLATKGILTKRISKPTVSSYPKLNNAISSIGCLRKHLAEEGISERISDLIVSSRREGTLSAYSTIISELAGVLNKTLIQFGVMWTGSWTFLPFCLNQDLNIGQYENIDQQFQFCITTLREDLLRNTRRSVLLSLC